MAVTKTTVPRVLLSIGDGVVNNYEELSAGDRFKVLNNPAPKFPMPKPGEPIRTIELALRIYGRDSEDLRRNQDRLMEQINAARMAASPFGVGTGVTLGVRFGHAQEWTYFDVLYGEWTSTQEITTSYMTGALLLTCLAEWRAASYPTTRTATLVCGAMTVFLDGVPGDAPALLQLSYVDNGSQITNHLVAGRYAAPDLQDGDFVPFIEATTLASTSSDSTAFGNSWARLSANSSWQDVCQFTGGSNAGHNVGFLRPFVRVRDFSSSPSAPTFPHASASYDTGTVPAGAYAFKVVATIGGTLSAASASCAATLTTAGHVLVSWNAVTGATGYRVYWQQNGGTWSYKATGGAGLTYSLTSITGGTIGQPPAAPTNLPSELQLRIGLVSGTTLFTTHTPKRCRQSSGTPEWLEFPPMWLPPIGLVEGQARQQWTIVCQARNTSGTYNVDVDAICLIPAFQSDGVAYLTADYPTNDLATLREWLLDTNRFGVGSGYLRNTGSGAEAGQVFVDGGLTAMPKGFGNTLVLLPSGAADASYIDELSGTVQLVVTPRGRALGTGTP